MSTILRSLLVATALIASASATMAAPRDNYVSFQNQSDNTSVGARAFFDAQQRNGN